MHEAFPGGAPVSGPQVGPQVQRALGPPPPGARPSPPRPGGLQHDGSVTHGLGLSPIGMITLGIAPWLLYCAAKWAIAERRADERDRRSRAIAAGKFPV